MKLVVDGKQVGERRVDKLQNGRWAVPRFDHTFATGGWHTGYVEVADATLPQDNRRYFAFDVLDTVRVLAVDGAPSQVAAARRAVLPQARAHGRPRATGARSGSTPSSPSGLTGADFGKYPLVILANVESLPTPAVEALEGYVDRGGSLLVFLGDQVDPEFYNPNLAAPTRLHGGLMPGRLLGREGDPAGAADVATVGEVDDAHAALSAFQDPQFAGFANVGFKALWGIDPSPTSAVLMRASTGSPLLAVEAVRQGPGDGLRQHVRPRLDELPRPAVVPAVGPPAGRLPRAGAGGAHRVLRHGRRSCRCPSRRPKGLTPVTVKTPDGALVPPVATGDPDEPLAFTETAEAGVYSLLDPSKPDARRVFAVNLESYESDLRYLDDALGGRRPACRPAGQGRGRPEGASAGSAVDHVRRRPRPRGRLVAVGPARDPGLGPRAGGRPGRRPVRALARQPDQPVVLLPASRARAVGSATMTGSPVRRAPVRGRVEPLALARS